MKRKSFTLVELMITVIVIGILSTVGVTTYHRVLAKARLKACAQNQELLLQATRMYAIENDVLPTTLTQLLPEHIEKAYAMVMKKEGPVGRMTRIFVNLNRDKAAYAAFLEHNNLELYGSHADAFNCPMRESGGYGINGALESPPDGLRWQDIEDGKIIIADCDAPVFYGADVALRHTRVVRQGAISPVARKGMQIAYYPYAPAGQDEYVPESSDFYIETPGADDGD